MGSGFVAAILPSNRKGVPPVPAAGKTPLVKNATSRMDYPPSTAKCRGFAVSALIECLA